MAGELQESTVQVMYKGANITLDILKSLIQTLVQNRDKITHGEQSVKKLNLQGKQLESVKLSGEDIKTFKRELKRHGVDFSVMKDRTTGEYSVFFKAQDIDRVYNGLEKCIKGFVAEKVKERKPIKEAMENAKKKAAEQAQSKEKSHFRGKKADRGQDI